MRLYLSSFRLGDRTDLLVGMAGEGARVAVIANSMDAVVERYRATGVAHRTLRDGQVIVVDGDTTTLY
jgi:hypothetical protein